MGMVGMWRFTDDVWENGVRIMIWWAEVVVTVGGWKIA